VATSVAATVPLDSSFWRHRKIDAELRAGSYQKPQSPLFVILWAFPRPGFVQDSSNSVANMHLYFRSDHREIRPMRRRAESEAVQAECQEWRLRFLVVSSGQLCVNFAVAPKRGVQWDSRRYRSRQCYHLLFTRSLFTGSTPAQNSARPTPAGRAD
jgi:hypothetical protein